MRYHVASPIATEEVVIATSRVHLVIGHTTDSSVRIWVRGDHSQPTCEVAIDPAHDATKRISLASNTDYCGVVDFNGLRPDTTYAVKAIFQPGCEPVAGRFRTFPSRADDGPIDFSFVLSSCNLPVIGINNLLAFLAASAGTGVALTALDGPTDRWRVVWKWLREPVRRLLKAAVMLVSGAVKATTDLKQPGQPYIRSPFLRLSAVFESCVLTLVRAGHSPAVGDVVRAAGARAIVAAVGRATAQRTDPTTTVVVAQVEGKWPEGASDLVSDDGKRFFGRVTTSEKGYPWVERPRFFLHVGDQIYYDFPQDRRTPVLDDYRLAYREAWFDDQSNRYFLSHWPHYMILDDHDIVDQYARDLASRAPDQLAEAYLAASSVAYREYVHVRHPEAARDPSALPERGPFHYCFDKGRARFFVLDTRTQRFNRADDRKRLPQMIDSNQMRELCDWLKDHPGDLKFVVTSVPFVVELTDKEPHQWDSGQRVDREANDKWCAPRFRSQRDEIIDWIWNEQIERVVFLTGDLHCCYHATMQIGSGSKYEVITVHELAGGPVNQLQLANRSELKTRSAGHTSSDVAYEVALDQFHGSVNAVLHLKVSYHERQNVVTTEPAFMPQIDWTVVRTLTDDPAEAWIPSQTAPTAINPASEPPMSGRISFTSRRTTAELATW